MKRALFVLIVMILVSVVLTACGDKSTGSTNDESAPAETTFVLETTAQGGTIEQDSEGNQITKDNEGKVVSVKDKNGNDVNVTEYLETHSWVEGSDSGNNNGSGADSVSGKSGSSKTDKSGGSQGSSSGKKDNASSGNSDDNVAEEEIPVVIATIPDEDTLETLPDF